MPLFSERVNYYTIRLMTCPYCNKNFPSTHHTNVHIAENHFEQFGGGGGEEENVPELNIVKNRDVFGGIYEGYHVEIPPENVGDVTNIFNGIRNKYTQLVREWLQKKKNFKLQFHLKLHFSRENNGETENIFPGMHSFNYSIENEQYGAVALSSARDNFDVRIEDFIQFGSGWRFEKILQCYITIIEFDPLSAGNQMELPPILKLKTKTIFNVPSDNNQCFKRCILAHLVGDYNKEPKYYRSRLNRMCRVTSKSFYKEDFYEYWEEKFGLDMTGIKYPVRINEIKKFERQNPTIGVNLFIFDEDAYLDQLNKEDDDEQQQQQQQQQPEQLSKSHTKKKSARKAKQSSSRNKTSATEYNESIMVLRQCIYPRKICKEKKGIVIDLLLVDYEGESHYVLIRDLKAFLAKQGHTRKAICRYCLQFLNKNAKTHSKYCAALGCMRTNFPEKDELMFAQTETTIRHIFLGAADFESRLERIHEERGNSDLIRKHVPSAYAWAIANTSKNLSLNEETKEQVVENDYSIFDKKAYVATDKNENVALKMILELLEKAEEVNNQRKIWNEEADSVQRRQCEEAEPFCRQDCGFCHEMIKYKDDAVRHHDHFPPYKYQFWAHKHCNSRASTPSRLVVLMHNLKGYDSHFIIKACAELDQKVNVRVIGTSTEKFFAIYVGKHLMFLDSNNFFTSSLDKVVSSMKKETDFPLTRMFINTDERFSQIEDKNHVADLLIRKGIYPYDYISDLSKYTETSLPPPEAFEDTLKREQISEQDYQDALTVWKELDVKDMSDYTKIYNFQDVFLLLDSFNKLRDAFHGDFELDPPHFFSLPHLTWQCALKYSGKLYFCITLSLFYIKFFHLKKNLFLL